MPEPINYEAVIADLQRRRVEFNATIDTAIASMRQVSALLRAAHAASASPSSSVPYGKMPAWAAVSASPSSSPSPSPSPSDDDVSEGSGPAQGTLAAVAFEHMRQVGRPQTNSDIAEALEKAGYEHKSANFPNNIGTALWREQKSNGSVIRHGRYWRLREWGEPNDTLRSMLDASKP